ncbi:MAG: osmotically-inducible protein OsmY [Crocinitomicaceae bacterium]|jgi:osmotically-inducible protein OsmY
MKTNGELQKDVINAIKWERSLEEAEIGVTAKSGVVTLSGVVDSYSKKLRAENAAKNIHGVKALAVGISVDYGFFFKKNDTEIAAEIINVWKYNWEVPNDRIKVKVEDGWAFLEGEVTWKFQEEASEAAIMNLLGVKGITNLITVKSLANDILDKVDIENAFIRNWGINARDIKVEVDHYNVRLSGTVHSLHQKDEAGRLAWNANGVSSVNNELTVIH